MSDLDLAATIEQVRAFAQQQHDEIKATYDFTGALDSHRHGFMCACADILAILATTPQTTDKHAEFIAHAREDVPALLDEIDRLNAIIQRVRDIVNDKYLDAGQMDVMLHRALEGGDS